MDVIFEFLSNTYNELDWFFQLGYVVVISTILSMLLVNLWKATFLKKKLVNIDATKKDKLLSDVGTITSLVVYGIVYVSNEMIIQHTFAITINWNTAWMTISSGAAVVWVAAKGLYTVLHKFVQRMKDKKLSKKDKDDAKADLDEVKHAVLAESEKARTLDTSIGKNTKKIL